MNDILLQWQEKAKIRPARIVLADLGDQRADEAAQYLIEESIAHIIEPVIDSENALAQTAADNGFDPSDPLIAAALLVKSGKADAAVAGATRSTGEVLKTGFQILGVSPEVEVVSSSFLMVLPNGMNLAYGDCAVLPEPNSEQLCSIAISTASTYKTLTGEEPRVAMLSFSTHGSADHPKVIKVRDAVSLIRECDPKLLVDGELQFDAAWVPEIAASKAPDSLLQGAANVFIFPDLDSANIAYKITERLAGARAIGPLLQGLDGIFHDLSRGCSTQDIIDLAVISALQSVKHMS
jgi:phosphate acetyltransferase|tara:strand:- start:1378 stop:2259 length:882 start_codon:yes stop_codon:yes gene_type:complete